jgi:putative transcriptional regulator
MTRFRVKELAQERGMTIEELAFKSGVKYSTVRNLWQNRVGNPNYSTLSAIARTIGVAIEELVDNQGVDGVKSGESRAPGLVASPA